MQIKLSGENASTSDSFDSSFGSLREELSLDDDWDVRESSSTENLLETRLGDIDHGGLGLVGGEL